jgi:hypothetical protein
MVLMGEEGKKHLVLRVFCSDTWSECFYVLMIILGGLGFVHIGYAGLVQPHTRTQRTFLVYRSLFHEGLDYDQSKSKLFIYILVVGVQTLSLAASETGWSLFSFFCFFRRHQMGTLNPALSVRKLFLCCTSGISVLMLSNQYSVVKVVARGRS